MTNFSDMNNLINLSKIYGISAQDYSWYQIANNDELKNRNLPTITNEYSFQGISVNIGVINNDEMGSDYIANIILNYGSYAIPVLNSGDFYYTPDFKYASAKQDGMVLLGVKNDQQ